jgi:hypothetical protein
MSTARRRMGEPSMADQQPRTYDLHHPMQPIGWDGKGVIRFKPNAIVAHLVEECRRLGGTDLHQVAIAVARGQFPAEDQVQLAQLLGYSVSGFGDLSYVPREMVRRADKKAERIIRSATP